MMLQRNNITLTIMKQIDKLYHFGVSAVTIGVLREARALMRRLFE